MSDLDYGALRWHLKANIYPPASLGFVDLCASAIDAAWRGDYDAILELPEGVTTGDGKRTQTAAEVIEAFRLHEFVESAS